MSTSDALDNLRSRILSRYTLLFLKTWEEERWEAELSGLAMEIERGLVVWTATAGPQPPPRQADEDYRNPLEFLEQIETYPSDHLFLLKDFHPYLSDSRVVRKLRDLASVLAAQNKTILFLGPVNQVPLELRKEAIAFDLPLPGSEELRDELAAVLEDHALSEKAPLDLSEDDEDRILKSVLGLTAREAHKAMDRALLGRDRVDDDVLAALVSEKRSMVEGSDLLEFYDFEEGVKDVGGLENLKDWVTRRAEAFGARAREQGIPMPKGVLLLGVQGCGKSLTARATARLLSFPLVRLDVANLLSSDQGASEKNMRNVLGMIETIAPAVLWVDEIEKGFAGAGGDAAQDATMSRLVGTFLTWMGELRKPVFVVATANAVAGLPPEMLRRGRFDELFFIDLPNYHERKHIFEIHLAKRGWKPEIYDVAELASSTEGFSGAEIEQIVISAMLDAYGRGEILSQEDLQQSKDQTVPLSVTMEEKVFELREWAATRCRRATPDSRVTQMLEEEHRSGEEDEEDSHAKSKNSWETLAEHGQMSAALVECVRRNDRITFPEIQELFSGWLEVGGEQGISLRSDPNVVLWAGMSKELAELFSKLIEGKRLYLHPSTVDAYKALGKGLKLAALPALSEERIAKPAWLPVSLRVLPPAGGSGRLGRVTRIKLTR